MSSLVMNETGHILAKKELMFREGEEHGTQWELFLAALFHAHVEGVVPSF